MIPDAESGEQRQGTLSACYGLRILSDVPLDDLPRTSGEPHVRVRRQALPAWPLDSAESGLRVRAPADEVRFAIEGVAGFEVRGGEEILVDPFPGVSEDLVRISILGSCMSLILHARGKLVLHGSAVVIDGGAVAIVGPHGFGKSTLAATLASRGHPFLTDDLLAIDLGGDDPRVLPGPARSKLWPDALEALGQEVDALPRLRPDLEKRGFRLSNPFTGVPPLAGILVLEAGASLETLEVGPHEALDVLLQNWFGIRFGSRLLEAEFLAPALERCARLIPATPIARLRRPNDLGALQECARLVEARFGRPR